MSSSLRRKALPETPTWSAPARPTVAIIGLGRVGGALGRALYAAGYPIAAVSSRDAVKAQSIADRLRARTTTPVRAAQAADLTLLTISDDAIEPMVHELADAGAWSAGQAVVHASGALSTHVLSPAAGQGALIGSFHPLAAFAGQGAPLPSGITFGVEAEEPLRAMLHTMAHALGAYPLDLRADQKTLYHAAAVIASNYTVTLAALAQQLFQLLGTTPEQGQRALLPLLRTTLDNLERQGLPDALTGPVARGDVGTVRRHLQTLDHGAPEIGVFYRHLAQATLELARQRGLDPATSRAMQDVIALPSELVSVWERES